MGRRLTVVGDRIYEERETSPWWGGQTSWVRITSRHQLMCPQRNRNYYQANDYLFGNTYTKERAAVQFHEFERNEDQNSPLLKFMMSVLEIDQIQVVTKLCLVDPMGTVWQSFMKISDTELVPLTYRSNDTRELLIMNSRLNIAFAYVLLHHRVRLIVPLAEGVAELVGLIVTGPTRAAGTRLGLTIARRYRRRALRYILQRGARSARRRLVTRIAVNIAAFTVKVCTDVALKIVQALRLEAHNNDLRRAAQIREQEINLETIIQESIRDAVADQFIGGIVSSFTALLPIPGERIISSSNQTQITEYIASKISPVALMPLTRRIRVILRSIPVSDSPQTFEENLRNNISQEFRDNSSLNISGLTAILETSIDDIFDHPASVGL